MYKEQWRNSGVFILNSALTVKTGTANSHWQYWDTFIKQIIQFISASKPCIWLLYGKNSHKFSKNIKNPQLDVKGYTRENIQNIPINNEYNYVMTLLQSALKKDCDTYYFVNKILQRMKVEPVKW